MVSIEKKYLKIGEHRIALGERKRIHLNFAALYDYTQLTIPVEVIRSHNYGPILFISAAIHGDEINGVEIIKRLLKKISIKNLKGTLILVPIVNVFGFNNQSRYLPDRRDLNRCFPGSPNGSLGARLAHLFMKEIVSKCTHGIDLHTGAIHRTNLPQIRAFLDNKETKSLAQEFGVPVIVNSKIRDGSLREAARQKNVISLLYEGGEALRFDENAINIGVKGCLGVMKKIGMIKNNPFKTRLNKKSIHIAQNSYWIRAPRSGSFKFLKKLGAVVREGDKIAIISDPFGSDPEDVIVKESGIIIGMSQIPLVNRGDAMVHIATYRDPTLVHASIELMEK